MPLTRLVTHWLSFSVGCQQLGLQHAALGVFFVLWHCSHPHMPFLLFIRRRSTAQPGSKRNATQQERARSALMHLQQQMLRQLQ
jgi:hypothetical protein